MKNFKEIRRKIGLTVAAGGIAFGGMFGAEKASAQDGDKDQEPSPAPLAQVVSPEDLGKPDNITVVENSSQLLPAAEFKVGDRFYLNSIEQEVTVMYADRFMVLLMPDKMGGDPHYYQPIEKIEVNPEYTPEMMEQNIWSFYWPQVYLDLIQNGRTTQDGRSYADELGLQGYITREAIWEVLQAREGNWPWIPYRYKTGGRDGQEFTYREGYANPNLPINIIPLPRDMTPPALSNKPVKPWIRIDSYQGNLVVPNSAVGVLVDQETGQISMYTGFISDTTSIAMLLYRLAPAFTDVEGGIRPSPKGQYEPWYYEWWEDYLKGTPQDFQVR